MKAAKLITQVAWVVAASLILGTLWADAQSRQRTECYRRAKAVAECQQPGRVERAIRWLYS
jgi:hypothetical protein